MKKLSFVVALVFALAICIQVSADSKRKTTGGQALGITKLHQIGGSRVKGDLIFFDSGDDSPAPRTGVSGRATGLNPAAAAYISLFYDLRSKSSGPQACEPSPSNDLTNDEMFAGQWVVEPDGSGKLVLIKAATYVSLFRTGTISIREVFEDGSTVVVACGNVSLINRSID